MIETTFSEFVTFINTHPQWRDRLLKALFPDLDIAKAFQQLAEVQHKNQLVLQALTERVGHIETDVAVLKTDVAVLKTDVSILTNRVETGFAAVAAEQAVLRRDVAQVKGYNYESRIIQHADAILGRFIRRGHNARNELGLLLEDAEDEGLITEQEHDRVMDLDLLWRGKQKRTKADIVLTVEVSWRAEETDITRSVSRAETLRKIGLTTLPVVAGLEWDPVIINLAHQHKVVCIINKRVDQSSWDNAL